MTRTVRRYLEALEQGLDRPADPARIQNRLDQVRAELEDASAVQRVKLIQERMDLEIQLDAASVDYGFSDIEADAVEVFAEWAAVKGISYRALRESGVPAKVLREAGISRAAS